MKRILALILLSLVIAGCAHEEFRQARVEVEAGNEEEGLARLEQQLKQNPNDVELRNYYERHKQVAVQRYLALGNNAIASPFTVERCRLPPSPTHSQCHGSGHALPPGSANAGWFQPSEAAVCFMNP